MSDFETSKAENNDGLEPTNTEDSIQDGNASFATRDKAFNQLMSHYPETDQTPIEEKPTTNPADQAFEQLMSNYKKTDETSAEKTVEIPATTASDTTTEEKAMENKQDTPIIYKRYVPPFEDNTRNPNWIKEETARLQAEREAIETKNPDSTRPEDIAWVNKILDKKQDAEEIDPSKIINFIDPTQDDSIVTSPATPVDVVDTLREVREDSTLTEEQKQLEQRKQELSKYKNISNGLRIIDKTQKEIKAEDARQENLARQSELKNFTNDNLLEGYNNTQTEPDRSQLPGEGDSIEKSPTVKGKRKKKSTPETDNSTTTTPPVNPVDSDTDKDPVYTPYVFPVLDPITPVIRNTTPTIPGAEGDKEFENLVNDTTPTPESIPDIDFENLVAGTTTSTEQNTTTPEVETNNERDAILLEQMRSLIDEKMGPINALAEQITDVVRELEPQITTLRDSLRQIPSADTEPIPTSPDVETREQQEARILEKVNQIIEQRLSSVEARMIQQQTDLSAQVTDLQNTIREINTRLQTLNTPVIATTATTNATTTPTVPTATPVTPTVATTPAAGTTEPTIPTPNVPGAATAAAETAQSQRMTQLENEIRTLRGQNTPEQSIVILKTQMETLLNGRNPSALSILEKSQYLDLMLARQQAIKNVENAEKESTEKRKKKERRIAIIAGIAGTGLAMVTPVVSVAAVIAVTLGGNIAAPLIKKGGEKLREKATAMKSADRNGQSLEQLKDVDARIRRNEWWANRLGEFAAVVSGGSTGYGVGKLFQGLLLAAGNITTSTSVNAAVKAQQNALNDSLIQQAMGI